MQVNRLHVYRQPIAYPDKLARLTHFIPFKLPIDILSEERDALLSERIIV